MSFESDIAAALGGKLTVAQAEAKIALRYAVQRAITCPYTGRVLDVRSAVLLEMGPTDTAQGGHIVLDAAHWDQVATAVTDAMTQKGATVTVYDGRILFGGA